MSDERRRAEWRYRLPVCMPETLIVARQACLGAKICAGQAAMPTCVARHCLRLYRETCEIVANTLRSNGGCPVVKWA